MARSNMLAWMILFLIKMATPRTLMSPLSLHFPAVQPSLLPPANAQATWPRELRRANLTDIHSSTLSRSSWRPPAALVTTGRPGYHAKKFISNLTKDADNSPLAIRDTWSAIQSILHSATSKQQLTATATCRFVWIPVLLMLKHPLYRFLSTPSAAD